MIQFSKSRRAFLKGAGSCIALPFLESIFGAEARSVDLIGSAPRRLCIIYGANGVYHPDWYPTDGSNWNSKILAPMQRHSSNYTLLKGLYNRNADYRAVSLRGGHGGASGAYLTAIRPRPILPGVFPQVGMSMDQIIAAEIAASHNATRIPSLQLMGRTGFDIDTEELPPVYTNSISWSSPTTSLIMETNCRKTFNSFFAGQKTPQQRMYSKSVLDSVLESGNRLRNQVSRADQMRLDEYLTNIRALEVKLDVLDQPLYQEAGCPLNPKITNSSPDDDHYQENLKAVFELAALAFQCDLTRVVTIMLSNEVSNMNYPFLNDSLGRPIMGGHHSMTHDTESADRVIQINKWEMSQVAKFLDQMTSIKEGSRTLLDNSLVVFGTGMRDSQTHQYDNLPFLLAGGGGGRIDQSKIARFRDLGQEVPLSNAWLGIMDMMMDSPPKTFGQYWDPSGGNIGRPDSTGILTF